MRRNADVHLGNPTRIREEVWTMNSIPGLNTLGRDLRHTSRQLVRSPWYTLTAVLILGIGIGSITAIFSVLDAVLFEPLPFAHPRRLIAIRSVPSETASIPTIEDWQRRSISFQSLAAYRGWSPEVRTPLGSGGDVLEVSQNFFSTLGASFAVGHDFIQTGDERDCPEQAILSGGFWKQLGGGQDLDGRSLQIDHRTFRIVGVLPLAQDIEGTYALDHPDIFVPIGCDANSRVNERGDNDFWVLGRLRPGVSIKSAAADLAHVEANLLRDYPNSYGGVNGRPPLLIPWLTVLTGTATGPALLTAFGACGLLLLLACANLANLMLARNVRRRQEFAVRAVLGAGARQLLRQMLIENGVLVLMGSFMGLLLANGALNLLRNARTIQIPRLEHASINLPAVAFAVCAAMVVALILTLLPATRTLRPSLLEDLAGHSRASETGSLRRIGRTLVAAQIAFSIMLVACASWMVAGIYTLLNQSLGFNPDHLLMVGVDIEHSSALPTYNAARASAYYGQLVAALRSLPSVTGVAAAKDPPLGGAVNRYTFCSDTHPDECRHPAMVNPDSFDITTGYFATVQQPLLEGRNFTANDDVGPPVVVVNQVLANREWPGQSAVGHRVKTGELDGWATVIGVVGNVRSFSLDVSPGADLYLPMSYRPPTHMVLLLRTRSDAAALAKTVRHLVHTQHPDLLLYHVRTMREEMGDEVEFRGFLMQIAIVYGALSLSLAILGVYGLLAYEISLRRKEIGIRVALGSSQASVVRLLLLQESRWVIGGAMVGLVAAMICGYALRAQIYGLTANSAAVLSISFMSLVLPALVAIAVPAWQVVVGNPLGALHTE